MKQTFMILGLVLAMNANSVFAQAKKDVPPTEAEIAKNQACFKELENKGCGTLEEDQDGFRSCMSSVHSTLDDHCNNLMLSLYGSN